MLEPAGSLFAETVRNFLGPILPFLEDDRVTEVMINGPKQIFVEMDGRLHATKAQFQDEDALQAAVTNIAQSVHRRIDAHSPRLDARLPNGYRIHAVIPPCARNGTTVAIRKFSTVQLTLKDLVQWGALPVDVAHFLDLCMKLGKNILVSGGTGSGKTTLLSVLCQRIPPGQRLIVIEDSSELRIDYEHCVFFETRMADERNQGEVSIRDLLKSALRLRPDRIIVGEVRGAEALELVQAMNTGHKGCLGTLHANNESDAMVRLEALAQGGESALSEKALRYQVASAVDLIVQISRLADGSRRLTGVSEVLGTTPDGIYQVEPLFQMGRLLRTASGRLEGQLEPVGRLPSFMQEIEDLGIRFPRAKFGLEQAS